MSLNASLGVSAGGLDLRLEIGSASAQNPADLDTPLGVFNFQVTFSQDPIEGGETGPVTLCRGAFSELTGIEATMEPRVIREGGRNWGQVQRAGQVSFATVVLKRGITKTRDLWWWFELMGKGTYSARLKAEIEMRDVAGKRVMGWTLSHAMPVKFKTADFNARGADIGVEELHIVHEGLEHST